MIYFHFFLNDSPNLKSVNARYDILELFSPSNYAQSSPYGKVGGLSLINSNF